MTPVRSAVTDERPSPTLARRSLERVPQLGQPAPRASRRPSAREARDMSENVQEHSRLRRLEEEFEALIKFLRNVGPEEHDEVIKTAQRHLRVARTLSDEGEHRKAYFRLHKSFELLESVKLALEKPRSAREISRITGCDLAHLRKKTRVGRCRGRESPSLSLLDYRVGKKPSEHGPDPPPSAVEESNPSPDLRLEPPPAANRRGAT